MLNRQIILVVMMAAVLALSGCSATHTAVAKKDLDVQTKMSDSIFLDPVSPQFRTVYVQIRNTSDKPGVIIEPQIKMAMQQRGYTVTDDPAQAHYWIQANVLRVTKSDEDNSNGFLKNGVGGAVTGGALGSLVGSGKGQVAAAVAGAIIGTIVEASVKDVYYTMVTDVQLSERSKTAIREMTDANIQQGTSTTTKVQYDETTDMKKYRTRIVSTANQVNLEFPEAEAALINGLAQSLSGIL